MSDVILAIDEGTTNAKVVCVDRHGSVRSRASNALRIVHPHPAWAEQDAHEILDAVSDAATAALSALPDARIAAVAISNQRESIVAWDRRTGQAVHPVIVWQCRRSEALCERIAADPQAPLVRRLTGLPIDPLFPAGKIHWLLQHLDDGIARAQSGEICIGTIDSWLLWHLTGGTRFVTDRSNASRTQLFDIHALRWDARLLDIYGVPGACLPEVLPSSAERGITAGFRGIPDGLPVLSQVGDSHAALYGQGGFANGVTKATYGTGSSLMTPVASIGGDDARLARTVAWDDGSVRYALEGNITHTGAAVDYMARLLGLADVATLAALAETVDGTEGVHFVPALSGLGAPHWDSKARGLVHGLTDRAGPAHLARAALESIGYQIADVFIAMQEVAERRLERLLVDGGPTRNRWLMQFQANLLDRPIDRARDAEVSAIGAAYLAGRALDWWPDHAALQALDRDIERIEPNANRAAVQRGYEGWRDAVRRTVSDDAAGATRPPTHA